jgi:acetate kinase
VKILVPNIGSTSLKWKLFEFREAEIALLHKGGFERVTDYGDAVRACLAELVASGALARADDLGAIGFKTIIAKGITGCVRIDERVLQAMEAYRLLAPAHNPPYIAGIRQFARVAPRVPLVALFETAFYQFAPDAMMRYAVPAAWHDAGVRRWGFHGASHKFIAERSAELLDRPDVAQAVRDLYSAPSSSMDGLRGGRSNLRVISCHLGGSSSITGILNGVAIGNSLGMSPQSGLPQNNRVGDLDSAALPYAMRTLGLSLDEAEQQLTKASGLKGLSGLSNDVRDLETAAATGHAESAKALDVYVASARHWMGAFFFEMGGVDAVVFTAGIGENDSTLRARMCAGLDRLGLVLDEARNAATRATEAVISALDSAIKVLVIPTNEELVVAREVRRLVASAPMASSPIAELSV